MMDIKGKRQYQGRIQAVGVSIREIKYYKIKVY